MEAGAMESAGGEGAVGAEDPTARAARKRYERLLAVRSKATKGKGAWYWVHLEPILVTAAGAAYPSAAKLRCTLCASLFSASNPSRTASEHLKRRACPHFSSPSSASAAPDRAASLAAPVDPVPISSLPPASPRLRRHRPLTRRCDATRPLHQPRPRLLLSGGKEDLVALERLEDSVKRLKSPIASLAALPKPQADSALALLSDWLFDSAGAVSPSALDHPKFQSFLNQVGLSSISSRQLVFSPLEARYHEVLSESEARIRDAAFFQLASDGWKSSATSSENTLVTFAVNLPNGTTLFHRTLLINGGATSDYAEELLWDAVSKISSDRSDRCAGIVANRFGTKALRNLEGRGQRMVNLSCQLQAFNSLLVDFTRYLPTFARASANCSKLGHFFNTQSRVRRIFHKYQHEEHGHTRLLRSCSSATGSSNKRTDFPTYFAVLEDVMDFARPIQMTVLHEDYKIYCAEEPIAKDMAELIQDGRFWTELEAVRSLVILVQSITQEIVTERPLIGQCLPLWDELRSKVREWRAKFNFDGSLVENLIEKRFQKNYCAAWSAAFVLDPLFLVKNTSGKYLPQFNRLSPEQEKDVDQLIKRLVSPEDVHIVLMELMKWRSEGLHPLYAQAVQVKNHDPSTGKTRIANPQSRLLVWETCLNEFKCLQQVAMRLIFLHATSGGLKRNSALMQWMRTHAQSPAAQKIAFLTAQSMIGRRAFSSEEEKDAALLNMADDGDDVVSEFVEDPSSA
ncbi:hypothetical protein ZIOFF_071550 [Zingiber officinale]|uniref:DUF7963 domain-containing protein n=2 Tax=Zingiber officinale TaxID=94328 RepID=A0A8J5EBI4_ZINOF|nr:hypothetical protein ZIOFF_071550 [Zingiber officinale]